ncbi:MAG TPA: MarR family transcriptional regulator [Dongiaceae bacterium]|jgi:DNA-binding MarR family transcriptional regulator|nr:MarR family transcriptional regulator [Dongiaceae bacterium]
MSNRKVVTSDMAQGVARACLCLHVQRAARALARHFDEVFRPVDLTSGQFSLLMSLNRPAPTIGETASFLAMDRTTLTAALKPLARRKLVAVRPDKEDRRSRRLELTPAGRAVLAKAYPLWCEAHGEIEAAVSPSGAGPLRNELGRLAKMLERPA